MYDSFFQSGSNSVLDKGMSFVDEIEDDLDENYFLRC